MPFAWSFETSESDYWLYFRGIEEWHVWKAHLNYWRFLLSTWYHQQSHKALILKIYELLESPAVMIRVVVRRRSPLLPWIWERHLKQHRCRMGDMSIFLIFSLMFSSETSMQTHESDLDQLESHLRIYWRPKPVQNQNWFRPSWSVIFLRFGCSWLKKATGAAGCPGVSAGKGSSGLPKVQQAEFHPHKRAWMNMNAHIFLRSGFGNLADVLMLADVMISSWFHYIHIPKY